MFSQQAYKNAVRVFKSLDWLNDPFGLLVTLKMESLWGKKYDTALRNEFATRFPRLKKFNIDKLPEEVVSGWGDLYRKRGVAWLEARRRQHSALLTYIVIHAPKVVLTETSEWHTVKFSDLSTFSTQTQPHYYAKGALKPSAELLHENGLSYRVVANFHESGVSSEYELDDIPDNYRSCLYTKGFSGDIWMRGYSLQAKIEPYQFEALVAQYDSIDRRKKILEKSGVNSKVIYPMG